MNEELTKALVGMTVVSNVEMSWFQRGHLYKIKSVKPDGDIEFENHICIALSGFIWNLRLGNCSILLDRPPAFPQEL